MTALDPTPVFASRRDALDQLDALREAVAAFLDQPTGEGLRLLVTETQAFVRREADELLPDVLAAGFLGERYDQLTAGHDAVAAELNRLSWAETGTAELHARAHRLRHELIAQADRYLALRLPRGALIEGR
jgi:hypothetical protein